MAGESCNLNKDEAEILKPSSSSSPSSHPSPPPPAAAPPSSLFLKPPLPQEFPAPERPGRFLEAPPPPAVDAVASAPQQNSKQEPHSRPTTTAPAPVPFVNRCSSCHKRVGLTGFRCRCGDLFCPRHRHSDTHECSFDYKTVGREQIAKANPLIRAAKIIKL